MATDPYIANLVTRIHSDLEALRSHGLLDTAELDLMRSLLPVVNGGGGAAAGLADQMGNLGLGNKVRTTAGSPAPHQQQQQHQRQQNGGASRSPAPPPPDFDEECRAKWDYNGADSDELSFRKGQVILIEEELSPDWWLGTLNGHTGLFPSNYVEKLGAGATTSQANGQQQSRAFQPFSNNRASSPPQQQHSPPPQQQQQPQGVFSYDPFRPKQSYVPTGTPGVFSYDPYRPKQSYVPAGTPGLFSYDPYRPKDSYGPTVTYDPYRPKDSYAPGGGSGSTLSAQQQQGAFSYDPYRPSASYAPGGGGGGGSGGGNGSPPPVPAKVFANLMNGPVGQALTQQAGQVLLGGLGAGTY